MTRSKNSPTTEGRRRGPSLAAHRSLLAAHSEKHGDGHWSRRRSRKPSPEGTLKTQDHLSSVVATDVAAVMPNVAPVMAHIATVSPQISLVMSNVALLLARGPVVAVAKIISHLAAVLSNVSLVAANILPVLSAVNSIVPQIAPVAVLT
jgi:hypothetical protein